MVTQTLHPMIGKKGRVIPRAHMTVGIELGELDPVRALVNDRCLGHSGPFACHVYRQPQELSIAGSRPVPRTWAGSFSHCGCRLRESDGRLESRRREVADHELGAASGIIEPGAVPALDFM